MLLGFAVAVSLVLLDLLLTRGIGWVFDVGFVLLCLLLALRVRPADFLAVAAFPPALLLGVFFAVALFHTDGSTVQALVTLLAEHAGALAVGYLLFLLCLAVRQRFVHLRGRESWR